MAKGGSSPKNGDRILILKEHWLKPVLLKEKKMEIRGRAYSPGKYWLGCKGQLHGKVVLQTAFKIEDEESWAKHREDHLVQSEKLPYKKTWALRVLAVSALSSPLPYQHPNGAIGLVRYRE